MMQAAVSIRRTTMPLRFRKRTAFHNSRIRQENSGYVNYERWWLLGFDICIEWGGVLDKTKPVWSYRAPVKAKP